MTAPGLPSEVVLETAHRYFNPQGSGPCTHPVCVDLARALDAFALAARRAAVEQVERSYIGDLKEYATLLGIDTTREGDEPGQLQVHHAIEDLVAEVARLRAIPAVGRPGGA